jgi:hypothetical protein
VLINVHIVSFDPIHVCSFIFNLNPATKIVQSF